MVGIDHSQDIITTDFCYEYLHFRPEGITLQLPGISIDMLRYWDGQPVQFVCCERGDAETGRPWGRVFWCVVIEMTDDVDDSGAESPLAYHDSGAEKAFVGSKHRKH